MEARAPIVELMREEEVDEEGEGIEEAIRRGSSSVSYLS